MGIKLGLFAGTSVAILTALAYHQLMDQATVAHLQQVIPMNDPSLLMQTIGDTCNTMLHNNADKVKACVNYTLSALNNNDPSVVNDQGLFGVIVEQTTNYAGMLKTAAITGVASTGLVGYLTRSRKPVDLGESSVIGSYSIKSNVSPQQIDAAISAANGGNSEPLNSIIRRGGRGKRPNMGDIVETERGFYYPK